MRSGRVRWAGVGILEGLTVELLCIRLFSAFSEWHVSRTGGNKNQWAMESRTCAFGYHHL